MRLSRLVFFLGANGVSLLQSPKRLFTLSSTQCCFKKVLLCCKTTGIDHEKSLYSDNSESLIKDHVARKGKSYAQLMKKHERQCEIIDEITQGFAKHGVQVNFVGCRQHDYKAIKSADLVIAVGGDGTFLSSALGILDSSKTIVGINSNPDTSAGILCLPGEWSQNISVMVDRLMSGQFKREYRHRLRMRVSESSGELVPLVSISPRLFEPHPPHFRPSDEVSASQSPQSHSPTRLLPVRALNDVFISACMTARVSRYELVIDDGDALSQKSSGLLVCTGTGSSSWHRSMHQMDPATVARILALASPHGSPVSAADAATIADQFNRELVFRPDSPKMAYSVRELVMNNVFRFKSPRGFAERLRVVSRMDDGYLCVDGWLAMPFNDGASVELSVHPEDALCVASLD